MGGGLFGLLHQGGWDEMLMVAVGLLLAYVVIKTTKAREDAAEEPPEPDGVRAKGRVDES